MLLNANEKKMYRKYELAWLAAEENMDVVDDDELHRMLSELWVVNHPEKYTEAQVFAARNEIELDPAFKRLVLDYQIGD